MDIWIIILIFLVFCIFPTLTVFSIFVTFFAIQSYYIIIPWVIITFLIDLFYIWFIVQKINWKWSWKYDKEFVQKVPLFEIINKK